MWIGALLFGLAGLLITARLRPDPRDLAWAIAAANPDRTQASAAARPLSTIMRLPAARLALFAMVVGQVVMLLIMSVTSLHMLHHQHSLGDVGTVLMAHTLGMFGLSVLTGPLADRLGRPLTIAGGALLLFAGSLLAPLSLLTGWLAFALFLVGLGWNLCYIAGSALLADILAPSERSQVQGSTELIMNLASATSSLGSGLIMAGLGYRALGLAGAAFALLPLALLGWQMSASTRVMTREA
jgi:MFS family permease